MLRSEAPRRVPADNGNKRLQMPIRRMSGLPAAAPRIANRIKRVEGGVSYMPDVQ